MILIYSLTDADKLICLLDKGCQHRSVLKAIMKMWTPRFYAPFQVPGLTDWAELSK